LNFTVFFSVMPIINVGSSGNNRRLETITSNSAVVSVAAASTLVRAANNDRTVLYVTNIGNNWVTIDHKTNPTYGEGIMLSPNGGAYAIESGNLDKRVLHGICAAGLTTTLAVYEGTGEEVTQT
jgi:hypothetical protein